MANPGVLRNARAAYARSFVIARTMVTILAAIRRFLSSGRRYNKTTLSRLLICVLGACAAIGMAAETRSFSKTVYPIFEEAGCAGCHNSDGVASATRLQFPEQSAPADRIEAFGKSLVVLVDPKNPANSLLLRKPTARIAHAGGQRIQPGSPEEAALRAWIDRLAQLKGDELAKALRYREEEASGGGATRPRIMLRRLTQQPVQQHGARSAGRPQSSRQPVSARGFRQRFQESVRVAESLAAAGRRLQRRRREVGAHRISRANARTFRLTCAPSTECRSCSSKASACAPSAVLSRRPKLAATRLFSRSSRISRRRAVGRRGDAAIAQFLFHLEDTANPKWRPTPRPAGSPTRCGIRCPTTRCSPPPAAANCDTPEGIPRPPGAC